MEMAASGDPLLLISGLGYGLWQWQKMIPGRADHFQVIAFDNRGAGQTDKPAGPYTAQMLAADAAGLLDAIGIDKAIVLGHSMGGFVGQAMALGMFFVLALMMALYVPLQRRSARWMR